MVIERRRIKFDFAALFCISDNGHSFDAVIYHGHEFTLVLWDLLMFCVADFASNDFVLAAAVTYVVDKVSAGETNLVVRRTPAF